MLKLTDLKKQLKNSNQKELVELIAELYKLSPDVKLFLSSEFAGDEVNDQIFENAKQAIKGEFFPQRGQVRMRYSVAKNAISHFKKMTRDEERTVDLMIYYVEIGTEFTQLYGDIDEKFYSSMASMFNKVTEICDHDEQLFLRFKDRLYGIVEASEGTGWGYHDILCDYYYSMYSVIEEE